MAKKSMVVEMTKEEVIAEYGLCAVCADRDTCEDKPEDMVLDLCSSYEDDGSTKYKVTKRR